MNQTQTTWEVWRRARTNESLVMSDDSEAQVREWHRALVEDEKVQRKQATDAQRARPLIRYSVVEVTVVRRVVERS